VTARVVELTFPAKSRYLVLARLSLAGIAPVAHLDADVLADLKLAVTEACANAVRHAYPDDAGGPVRLRLELDDGTLTIEVADEGRGLDSARLTGWDPELMHEQGMGFAIMRSAVDEVEVGTATNSGTVVRLVKRLRATG
jgi:serine/threonine-protein kinase RsbW